MNQALDYIYTMLDYYDGSRTVITTVHGQPHAYQSLWTDQDGGADTFVL